MSGLLNWMSYVYFRASLFYHCLPFLWFFELVHLLWEFAPLACVCLFAQILLFIPNTLGLPLPDFLIHGAIVQILNLVFLKLQLWGGVESSQAMLRNPGD